MTPEIVFRILTFVSFVAMTAIRVTFQRKALKQNNKIDVREGPVSLIAGSIAALSTLVFGFAYIFLPIAFAFSYANYPHWLRWLGVFLLSNGIILLYLAHRHLGKSFHSLVVTKKEQTLITTGPYHWIRHPIYTAFLINYLGGGLLAGSWILTVIPLLAFGLLVAIRLPQEESVMQERFGQDYTDYMKVTGRLLPKFKK